MRQPRGGADDVAMVAAMVDGDGDALAEMYRRYGGAVWAVARRVCGDRTLAEDVTQTVFVDLWRRPQRFDPARVAPALAHGAGARPRRRHGPLRGRPTAAPGA